MERIAIEQAFLHAGLQARVPAIDALTRNSIRLLTRPVDEETLRPGDSKIGGLPDLPAGVRWPQLHGQPQAFLAQIRLADVQPFDKEGLLPRQGMLWFFYDAYQQTFGERPQDRAGWCLSFCPACPPRPERAVAPAGLAQGSRFQACALALRSELTLALDAGLEQPAAHWSAREQQAYEQVLEAVRDPGDRAQPHHRLLGYPDTLQDDMREQCRRALPGAGEWLLLLQIDTDAAAGMRWANNGMLYYWIRRDDLRARRFADSWLVLQSE